MLSKILYFYIFGYKAYVFLSDGFVTINLYYALN